MTSREIKLNSKITRSGDSGFTIEVKEVKNIPQTVEKITVKVGDINEIPVGKPTALSATTSKDQRSLTLEVKKPE